MRHWRAILRMTSPLATPLTASRLFGHICWGLAWREGPEAVAEFLGRMRSDAPPLVLGEPMPVGFAPMPVVLRSGLIPVEVGGKRQAMWERYRRRGIMPRAALLRAAEDLGNGAAVKAAMDAAGWLTPVLPAREMRLRSAASRLSGASLGRNDWMAVETWEEQRQTRGHDTAADGQVEVLIVSDLETGEIGRLLGMGLENGVGRAAGVGYGQVELAGIEEIADWPAVEGATGLVTLGACAPRRDDPAGGWWEARAQWGKLGGPAGEGVAVEKQPVMTLKAGAVLTAGAGVQEPVVARDFVGRLVAGVHPQRPEVVHYGMAPALAVRM